MVEFGQAYHCALGDEDTTAIIHRNEFTPCSSLLPIEDLHGQEFPHSARSSKESIAVRRFDGMADELDLTFPMIAKIDVQVFEDRVIRGGRHTLQKATAIVVELSAYSLYQWQATFSTVHGELESMGFVFRGTIDQTYSAHDGRIVQFDGLFEKTAPPSVANDE